MVEPPGFDVYVNMVLEDAVGSNSAATRASPNAAPTRRLASDLERSSLFHPLSPSLPRRYFGFYQP